MKQIKRFLILLICAVFALSALAVAACDTNTDRGNTELPSDSDTAADPEENPDEGSDENTDSDSDENTDSGSDEAPDEGSDENPDGGSDENADSGSDENTDEGSDENPDGGSEENTPPAGGEFTVKIGTYDAEKGTVTVSAPKDGVAYAVNEQVTVTAEGKEGFEPSAILLDGEVVARLFSTYTFLYTEPVTVSAVFAGSTEDIPEVKFSSPTVKNFASAFRGHWVSEQGNKLFIGEKKLSFHGTAVTSVAPRSSGNEQTYNFTVDSVNYSMAWARTDYTVGNVLDVLDLQSGTREYFVPDPLPLEKVGIDQKYAGDWTAVDEDGTFTLSVGETIVYNGKTVEMLIDGGYRDKTNDMFAMPIGAHIYFFLQDGLHILMWNGGEGANCPSVDDHIFSGAREEKPYTFPEALRGTWKSADGKTAVITEGSFTLDGTEIAVRGEDAAFLFRLDGTVHEAALLAGSEYILQFTVELYGAGGLVSGYAHEYLFREGRPAVTPNAALDGTWTAKNSTLIVQNGTIAWDGKTVTLIEQGEARADGYVWFAAVEGKVYELSLLDTAYTAGAHTAVWEVTLSGDDGTYIYTK